MLIEFTETYTVACVDPCRVERGGEGVGIRGNLLF